MKNGEKASTSQRRAVLTALACLALSLAGAAAVSSPASASGEPACQGSDLDLATRTGGRTGEMLDRAISAIDQPTDADLDRLRTWFGIKNSSDAARVRQVFVNAKAFVGGVSYRCSVVADARLGDVYAYVMPDTSFAIVLGAFFYSAPDDGYDSRPGIITHEMTHFALAGATADTVYGRAGAMKLASQNPTSAQKNADNYEYFAEASYFNLS